MGWEIKAEMGWIRGRGCSTLVNRVLVSDSWGTVDNCDYFAAGPAAFHSATILQMTDPRVLDKQRSGYKCPI